MVPDQPRSAPGSVRQDAGPPQGPRAQVALSSLVQPHTEVEVQLYTYKVVELREKMLGGKMSGEKLERLLNEHARDGWQLKAITAVEVKGRVGPGGVDGLLVTLERSDSH